MKAKSEVSQPDLCLDHPQEQKKIFYKILKQHSLTDDLSKLHFQSKMKFENPISCAPFSEKTAKSSRDKIMKHLIYTGEIHKTLKFFNRVCLGFVPIPFALAAFSPIVDPMSAAISATVLSLLPISMSRFWLGNYVVAIYRITPDPPLSHGSENLEIETMDILTRIKRHQVPISQLVLKKKWITQSFEAKDGTRFLVDEDALSNDIRSKSVYETIKNQKAK